jgi:hypothetical protein
MTSPSERELLSQQAARQLLERAGEIDSDSMSVDTLRAAAREAGISEAAFDAALVEMRGKIATHSTTRPRRSLRWIAFGAVAAALLMVALSIRVPPGRVSRSEVGLHEFIVRCIPMQTAGDIARTTLGPNAEISWTGGSRVMRARITTDEFVKLQNALAAAAKVATTCEK